MSCPEGTSCHFHSLCDSKTSPRPVLRGDQEALSIHAPRRRETRKCLVNSIVACYWSTDGTGESQHRPEAQSMWRPGQRPAPAQGCPSGPARGLGELQDPERHPVHFIQGQLPGVHPTQAHRALGSEGPLLGLILCCCHLEIFCNFLTEPCITVPVNYVANHDAMA